jgi:hypothetical protein
MFVFFEIRYEYFKVFAYKVIYISCFVVCILPTTMFSGEKVTRSKLKRSKLAFFMRSILMFFKTSNFHLMNFFWNVNLVTRSELFMHI